MKLSWVSAIGNVLLAAAYAPWFFVVRSELMYMPCTEEYMHVCMAGCTCYATAILRVWNGRR